MALEKLRSIAKADYDAGRYHDGVISCSNLVAACLKRGDLDGYKVAESMIGDMHLSKGRKMFRQIAGHSADDKDRKRITSIIQSASEAYSNAEKKDKVKDCEKLLRRANMFIDNSEGKMSSGKLFIMSLQELFR